MSKIFLNEKKITKLLKLSEPIARDHAIFHVALATGFRASDLLNLKRCDIAPQGTVISSIRIKMQKTGKMIERVLPPTCRSAIELYLGTRVDRNPFLFCSKSNNSINCESPMNRSSLHRIFKQYLGILFSHEELRGNACHVTRRSVAKILSDRSGRIETATRFLGHNSPASTIAYLDMDEYNRIANNLIVEMKW